MLPLISRMRILLGSMVLAIIAQALNESVFHFLIMLFSHKITKHK